MRKKPFTIYGRVCGDVGFGTVADVKSECVDFTHESVHRMTHDGIVQQDELFDVVEAPCFAREGLSEDSVFVECDGYDAALNRMSDESRRMALCAGFTSVMGQNRTLDAEVELDGRIIAADRDAAGVACEILPVARKIA